jgi:hypothetical protein
MKNFHKNLNIAFMGGLFGVALMTWLAPRAIAIAFTPPVSFGVNCEPVGHWSMQKLIICQIVGIVLGTIITFWVRHKLIGPKEKNAPAA